MCRGLRTRAKAGLSHKLHSSQTRITYVSYSVYSLRSFTPLPRTARKHNLIYIQRENTQQENNNMTTKGVLRAVFACRT